MVLDIVILTPFTQTDDSSAPLLSNILPHLQTLLNFITNTLPRPVLVALLYRLIVLHFASRILPTIGADAWDEPDEDEIWAGRPVSLKSWLYACSLTDLTSVP